MSVLLAMSDDEIDTFIIINDPAKTHLIFKELPPQDPKPETLGHHFMRPSSVDNQEFMNLPR
jgi:hypothetical protein